MTQPHRWCISVDEFKELFGYVPDLEAFVMEVDEDQQTVYRDAPLLDPDPPIDYPTFEELEEAKEYQEHIPTWPMLFGFPDGFVRCATFGRNPNLNPYTGKLHNVRTNPRRDP